ncbi:MAG: Na/Pi symporter [Desulfobacterales bacterium]|nr:Na/Pi symporter [Desulfobacterales bacterium]
MNTLTYITMAAQGIGGLGLFLLGMMMMTDGLKMSAGHGLRHFLTGSTKTALRGILSGASITSLVQSSSAVTVATIGFVNAGLLTLGQAILLIYGSNIGTTMTGWLVALVGFHANIKVVALPAVGIGMLVRLLAGQRRYTGAGEAIAGFGIFFLGIEILKTAFTGLEGHIQLGALTGNGPLLLVLFAGIGVVLTFLMQSSSAAMAIILTAAGSGLIPVNSAAALVIGANIGTTTTAILATIGATANAKRVAAAHVAFNLVTGCLALLFLPLLLSLVTGLLDLTGREMGPVTVLALFHTTFNLAGVILFLPFTGQLVSFLGKRFRETEEDEGRPRYLDKNVVTTPVLALHAMAMELARIGAIARRTAMAAISSEEKTNLRQEQERVALNRLVDALGEFSTLVQRNDLPPELDNQLPNAMRVSRYYQAISELSHNISRQQRKSRPIEQEELVAVIGHFKKKVVRLLEETDASGADYDAETAKASLQTINQEYQRVKSALLRAGAVGQLSTRKMVHHLELLSEIRRIADQAEKGARFLAQLINFPTPPPREETGPGKNHQQE